jgi:dihydroorotase
LSGPLLIRGGRVVDPSQSLDAIRDVLMVDGVVAEVGERIDPPVDARDIDAGGLVVTPGLIDVHVHLREPGGEHKETIATGAMAAAAGGFTAVCAMPNTDPVVDDPAGVCFVLAQGVAAGGARVYPMGAISVGQEGKQLAAIGEMFEAGAVGITDDGNPVMDSGLMRRALEYAQAFDIPVADHPEDLGLSDAGVMNEGLVATKLGLRGKPNAAEDVHIVRDLLLAELTGGHIHLQHISTAYGVEAIRQAKARGVRVTAEASPHHLILTDERVEGFDTDAKMNPPLRSPEDREVVRDGLSDGTLDVFATDHAPHHYDEKEQAFADAPNGIIGLETGLGLGLTHVVGEGLLDLPTLVHRMSVGPAQAFGLPGGTLAPGSPGDVTIIDLEKVWTVDRDVFLSKSRNTPFHGWELKGRALYTIVGGVAVWEAGG